MRLILILALFSACISCNYFTYTPRSANNRYREMPTAQLYEQIVDFRETLGGWPSSRQDFISKNIRYYKALEGFKYNTLVFT